MAEQQTTAAAENQNNASASAEASGTSLATASETTDTQTQSSETQSTQSTETPAATETTAAKEEAKPAETKPATQAPEKYEFKAPEGTEFDPGILSAFEGAAKEADLSQDAAQKVLDKMAPALAERQAAQIQAVHTQWTEASKADKEFGDEKLKENLGVAKKTLDEFDPIPAGEKTTPLRTLLDTTGLGNHPEVLRLLYRAGKAISEDKFVGGKPGSTPAVDATQVLYPTMKKE